MIILSQASLNAFEPRTKLLAKHPNARLTAGAGRVRRPRQDLRERLRDLRQSKQRVPPQIENQRLLVDSASTDELFRRLKTGRTVIGVHLQLERTSLAAQLPIVKPNLLGVEVVQHIA